MSEPNDPERKKPHFLLQAIVATAFLLFVAWAMLSLANAFDGWIGIAAMLFFSMLILGGLDRLSDK